MTDFGASLNQRWRWLALLGAIAVIWFTLLGYRDLLQPDEGRYAEIPREMVASGDWLTPRLNGVKYFEKPALQYWATAIGYELFGESNATARLWPALLGFLTIPWLMWLGVRLFNRDAGWYAGLMLAGTLMWVAMGHTLTLDTALSAFLALGVGALLLAQTRRDQPAQVRGWMLVGWTALALAMLTKGLIALVLPGGALVVYSLWQRDWALWRHLHLGKGLLVFLAITAPWFILVSRANPRFAEFFFVHEHFARYTSNEYHYSEPWWYFIPLLFLLGLPWIGSLAGAIIRPGDGGRRAARGSFDPLRFLWIYAVFTVGFFSLSHSKLAPYLQPVYPALALLAGERLSRRPLVRIDAAATAILAAALLALTFNLQHFVKPNMPLATLLLTRPWLYGAAGALGAGVLLAWRWRFRGRGAITALGLAALLGFQCLSWGYQSLATMHSSHRLAEAIAPVVASGKVPIYNVGRFEHALPFYLKRTIELVMYRGEMDFGLQQQPQRYIASLDEFAKVWRAQQQAVAVMEPKIYQQLEQAGLPMTIIYQDPRRVAVSRR